MKALFLGRFQPFHLGHLSIIQSIAKRPEIDEIIIAIGSANESHTAKNPFTVDERSQMITKSVHIDKAYSVIAIPDFDNHQSWLDYIVKHIPELDIVFTTNPKVKAAFQSLGLRVVSLDHELAISASQVRDYALNNSSWTKYVPKEVEGIIHQINGIDRLSQIQQSLATSQIK